MPISLTAFLPVFRGLAALVLCAAAGCAHSAGDRRAAALPAMTALQQGRFEEASELARDVLAKDGKNAQARVVQAITRFRAAGHQFLADAGAVIEAADHGNGLDHKRARTTAEDLERALGRVDEDLAVAAEDSEVSLELCLACWRYDWNRNGRVDRNDERLFQVEVDAEGKEYPENDPRRRPTFRFDVADVHWARAMLGFQRAFLDFFLAYDFTGIEGKVENAFRHEQRIEIQVGHKERFSAARTRLLEALEEADRTRVAILAETDDDREWVPSPRQKSHPLPLPVDDKLFETWAGIVGDARRLLNSEEGIDVAAAFQLGDKQWEHPPGGFIDVGKMLSEPRPIVIELGALDHADRDPKRALESFFGSVYVPKMKSSPLPARLDRMKNEMERGEESLERKLRYLLWLN